MSAFRRIVCATDFSPPSRAALRQASRLARESRGKLWIVHVVGLATALSGYEYLPLRLYDEIEADYRRAMKKRVGGLAARARRSGVAADSIVISEIPEEGILRAARQKKADLIVVGTHGRRGLTRIFLGSVASRVVAAAPCPVLTVRGR